MSKFTEQLRAIRIFNPYNLVADGHPWIWYRPRGEGRDITIPAVMLSIKGKKFKTHWTNHGSLNFTAINIKVRKKALEEALAKCKELFPDLEMVKGPWRMTWVPKVDLDAAKERIKQKSKEED